MSFDFQKFEKTVGKPFFLELRKSSWILMKDKFVEAGRLAEKNVPPHRLTELNEFLWVAFLSNRREEMFRLIKAGADPHSVDRMLEREMRESRK